MFKLVEFINEMVIDKSKVVIYDEASDMREVNNVFLHSKKDEYGGKYIALCDKIYFLKDGKKELVTNLYNVWDFDKRIFHVLEKEEVFIPKEITDKLKNSKLKNLEGNDMIFLHGTYEDFEEFSMDFVGMNYNFYNRYKGLYFTAKEADADMYGPNVKFVGLDSRKPLKEHSRVFTELRNEWKDETRWAREEGKDGIGSFQEFLLTKGYDSIVSVDKYGVVGEIIVFDVSQIHIIESREGCKVRLNQLIDTSRLEQ